MMGFLNDKIRTVLKEITSGFTETSPAIDRSIMSFKIACAASGIPALDAILIRELYVTISGLLVTMELTLACFGM